MGLNILKGVVKTNLSVIDTCSIQQLKLYRAQVSHAHISVIEQLVRRQLGYS